MRSPGARCNVMRNLSPVVPANGSGFAGPLAGTTSSSRGRRGSFPSDKPYLLHGLQGRSRRIVAKSLVAAGQRIGAGETAEADAAACFDGTDRDLGRDLQLQRGK